MDDRPIKAALLQVHSFVGIAIALVLVVVATTGAMMSFEDEIQDMLNAGVMRVEPRSASMLAPDELIARLQPAHDFGRVSAVMMTSDRAAAARIWFAHSGRGSPPTSVYVDPYDGHLLGVPRGEDFFATVRKVHRWLLIPGDIRGYGRQVTGVVALGFIAMLISGLVLRWPRHTRSVRVWLKPNLTLRGRGWHWSLHSVIGTWVLAIYLVIVTTGLWYSFDWYRNSAIWLFSTRAAPSAPAQQRPLKAHTADGAPLMLDRVWSVFLQSQGNRYTKALLMLPPDGGTAVGIRSWSHDAWHDGARDEFRIDAVTGRITLSEIYADKPFGEKVLANVLDIHRGILLGWPGRLLFMLAALCMPVIAVTGFILYLSRRKHRRLSRQPVRTLAPGE
jgi:sulfite reductase (NADPH) flavoprotein alpha-component